MLWTPHMCTGSIFYRQWRGKRRPACRACGWWRGRHRPGGRVHSKLPPGRGLSARSRNPETLQEKQPDRHQSSHRSIFSMARAGFHFSCSIEDTGVVFSVFLYSILATWRDIFLMKYILPAVKTSFFQKDLISCPINAVRREIASLA